MISRRGFIGLAALPVVGKLFADEKPKSPKPVTVMFDGTSNWIDLSNLQSMTVVSIHSVGGSASCPLELKNFLSNGGDEWEEVRPLLFDK